jgi:hypothetical protein
MPALTRRRAHSRPKEDWRSGKLDRLVELKLLARADEVIE